MRITMTRLLAKVRRDRLFAIGMAMVLTIVFVASLSWEARASDYPEKPITVICPWPAGTSLDNFARSLSGPLEKELGASVNVVAKPGGSGMIGTLAVMKSRPDGYTLLIDCPGTSSIQKAWSKELPYKVEERTWLTLAGALPTAFSVRSSAPWKTLDDVEQAIREDPAGFRWPACGTSYPEYPMGLFRAALRSRGVDLSQTKTVPFQGASKAFAAMAGGHVDMYCGSRAVQGALVDAGKLRAIAVTSAKRVKFWPGLPTATEQGFPVVCEFWLGFAGPPGLPENVVNKWIDAVRTVVNDPANSKIFDRLGMVPTFKGGDDFREFVMNEAEKVKAAGLK